MKSRVPAGSVWLGVVADEENCCGATVPMNYYRTNWGPTNGAQF